MGKAAALKSKLTTSRSASPDSSKSREADDAQPGPAPTKAGDDEQSNLDAPEELEMAEGNPESETGKLKQLLGVLKKSLGVKDLAGMRLSLPANLLEPIGNLEHWHYQSRPDVFAAIPESDDPVERMLAVLRYAFSKDLKHVRQGVCKPYNSALGEQFRSIWDVQPAVYDATSHTFTCNESLDPDHKIVEPAANASRTSIDGADETASLSSKRSSRIASSTSDTQLADATKSKLSLSSKASSTHSGTETADTSTGKREKAEGVTRVVFLNEQVSHHPPISAFWNESVPANPNGQKVVASGYDQISAKFTGTSVKVFAGPSNKGIFVRLPGRGDEEYQITHPTASVSGFFRGNLYISVSDQSYITCRLPNGKGPRLRAIITYVDEGWLGKAKYAVEGVVYEYEEGQEEQYTKIKAVPDDKIVAKISGSWRGKLMYALTRGDDTAEHELLDIASLLVVPKIVRPLARQGSRESRRFWLKVSESIHKKEFSAATKHKQAIEQAQRDAAAARQKNGEEWQAVLFGTAVEESGRPYLSEGGKKALKEEIGGEGYDP